MLLWAKHRHASYYLGGISFAEASFFPLPPYLMLLPIVLDRPVDSWLLARITICGSVIGGIFGYLIGYFAYDIVGRYLVEFFSLQPQYEILVEAFQNWGPWIIAGAGIIPIPYKICTMTAGVSMMPLVPFILASIIGRSVRFFLVAGLVRMIGPRIETHLIKYIDYAAWLTISIVIISVCLLKFG